MYDEEIGYVQGISFLAASLLLHVSILLPWKWDRDLNKHERKSHWSLFSCLVLSEQNVSPVHN